jgi:hypothetical protein
MSDSFHTNKGEDGMKMKTKVKAGSGGAMDPNGNPSP